jgi:hypothetical protein
MIKLFDGQTTVTPVPVGESIWLGLFANILRSVRFQAKTLLVSD